MGWWKDLNFLRRGAPRPESASAKAPSREAKAATAPREAPKKAIPADAEPVPPQRAAAIRAAALSAAAASAKGSASAVQVARAAPPVAPARMLPLTPQREALILDAMRHWAHGHAIFQRLEPRIREQIRALAEQLAPR